RSFSGSVWRPAAQAQTAGVGPAGGRVQAGGAGRAVPQQGSRADGRNVAVPDLHAARDAVDYGLGVGTAGGVQIDGAGGRTAPEHGVIVEACGGAVGIS